jgi:tetratricopeptide (TPR) repeat protein
VLALDPNFAPAYAHLAMAEFWGADYAGDAAGVAAAQRQAMADAESAIRLDPTLPDGYWARGNQRANLTWDWQGARADFEKALRLRAADTRVLQGYGSLLASLGELPQAIAITRRAAERDPLLFSVWHTLGGYLQATGQLDEARIALLRAQALSPEMPFVQFRLGLLELQRNRPKPALEVFRAIKVEPIRLLGEAMAQHDMRHASESQLALNALVKGYGYNAAYQVAEAYAWRDQPDEAFEWLDRAFVQRDGGLAEVKYDPALRSLRKDPRFKVLLRKLGLPPA